MEHPHTESWAAFWINSSHACSSSTRSGAQRWFLVRQRVRQKVITPVEQHPRADRAPRRLDREEVLESVLRLCRVPQNEGFVIALVEGYQLGAARGTPAEDAVLRRRADSPPPGLL